MALFPYVLFAHVAAAVGLFAALALEWVSVRRLAAATTYEQAREWTALWGALLPLGLPAVVVALASGIYLATTLGPAGWGSGWIQVAVPTLVAVAVTGAIVGPRRARLRAALSSGGGSLAKDLRLQLRHPIWMVSWSSRAALLTGLLFVMTAKPDLRGALAVLALSAAAAVGWSLLGRRLPRAR